MNKSTSLASHDVTSGAGAVAEKEAAFAAFFAPSNDVAYQPEPMAHSDSEPSECQTPAPRPVPLDLFLLPSASRAAWSLWQEIIEQVATALHCPPDERRNIKAQFATGDVGFMRVLLSTAKIYEIPLTNSFEFWQLVRPDLHWVYVIDERFKQSFYMHFDKIAPGAANDGRDLYHGATLRLSELVPEPLG
ncbi:hypothetical protein [uncultured Deefgea sp.]|uniref:hypothetical protein n=1 Tax=uncultured Deefgea sp. TaxID=1304914 RepID=UPI002592B42D|nr:hypothetical protein [uncultured Deefgea sp.]